MTSNSKAEGRFGRQDFRYIAEKDVYGIMTRTPQYREEILDFCG
jgi:hypothetical protein